ncbi:MAG TPA: GNAT family N-acetyltransferase [Candidatus Paceibacterota bacterium]|nr:GNAT family N-acetyltransferase [Candidatus Paceibacterota bacterium]
MENSNFTKKENFNPEFEIIKSEDLFNEIYKGGNLPDKRFFPFEKGGVFKYFDVNDIPSIYTEEKERKIYPAIKIQNLIVALSELEKNPYKENNLWIKFISVDPKYQNNGYAKKLIEEIFNYAKENNFSLTNSIYSDEGKEKLKHIVEELKEKSGVKVENSQG